MQGMVRSMEDAKMTDTCPLPQGHYSPGPGGGHPHRSGFRSGWETRCHRAMNRNVEPSRRRRPSLPVRGWSRFYRGGNEAESSL